MAPATRSRQAVGVKKAPPARKSRTTRSTAKDTADEWTFGEDQHQHQQTEHDSPEMEHHYNGSLVVDSREAVDMDFDDADHPMDPIREMAERVGREAETFAENLDRLLASLATGNKYEAVMDVVEEFKSVARDAAFALRKNHERERAQRLRKEWSEQANIPSQTLQFGASKDALALSTTDENRDPVTQMRKWQQEADLWELFSLVLELHHNPDRNTVQRENEEKIEALGEVHRYSSEDSLWNRFLLQDDLARERALVKKWLERTAEHQTSDLHNIMEELEAKAGRGKGLWSEGWLHTHERIKGEKRLRSWPTTPGAPLPHIKRSDNNELLVTTLDPDATSRQDRTLEKPDAYLERALWIACWEMLRRGMSWEEVSDWCRRHHEGWRAISIGRGKNPEDVRSNAAWRNACYLASQANNMMDYEAAVYGLLGGSVNAVQRICRNVDDTLYAHYNAALVQQFDQYLASYYPDRAAQGRRGRVEDALRDPGQQIVDLILRLRKQPETKKEAKQPLKIVQSYLLANDMNSMVNTLGYAIAYTDEQEVDPAESIILPLNPFWSEDGNLPEEEVALDPQALRIATHIALVMRALSEETLEGDARYAEENVIVAYIQALRMAGKRDLIPMYASRLSLGRQVVSMSRIIEDIKSPSEQQTVSSLFEHYNMDTIMIVNESLYWLLTKYVSPLLGSRRRFQMLEKVDDTRLYPGQRIQKGFLPQDIDEGEQVIVNTLQWYSMINGYWSDCFQALSTALRKCLVAGRIACAMRIVAEYPFENLSLRKSHQAIGTSINMMEYDGPPPANESARWDILKRQCRSYYELEQIVNAIKALSDWRELESDYTSGKHLRMSAPPQELKDAKEVVDYTMTRVLSGNILQQPQSTDEATDMAFIRDNYLPEVIIAYNTVLHTAGSLISRDNLIESMDLSVTIAESDNTLAECIMNAGRMRELVASFAQTSKLMLVLKSTKAWKPKKDREGKDLGIWEIGPQGAGNEGLAENVVL